jgi:hypothetical protein
MVIFFMAKINPNQDYLKYREFSLAPFRNLSVDKLIVLLAKFVMYPTFLAMQKLNQNLPHFLYGVLN